MLHFYIPEAFIIFSITPQFYAKLFEYWEEAIRCVLVVAVGPTLSRQYANISHNTGNWYTFSYT